jgi:CelD/BcsL family acetyltransferase involved in cellulose biosynthesis
MAKLMTDSSAGAVTGVDEQELERGMKSEYNSMDLEEIDPLQDPRWPSLVRDHPCSSIFHTCGWLEALRRTYHFRPAALVTLDSQDDLSDALVFCRANSWLTGRRLVSVPFSDHCDPLLGSENALPVLIAGLLEAARESNCKYIELRPALELPWTPPDFHKTQAFYLHRLDLRPGASAVFRNFHPDCIQRKIRRAERQNLQVEEGRDTNIVQSFYRLLLRTRRRHGLPPQPITWFHNLVECLGDSLHIRLAYKDATAIAGILTLEHRKTLVYKYGASDERFHNLGGIPCLFWHAIQDAIDRGFEVMDMGRSDIDNPGLIAFKDHWGAHADLITYWTYPEGLPYQKNVWKGTLVRRLCSSAPDVALRIAGTLFYKHAA